MEKTTLRQRLLPLQQQQARASEGWTLAVCSPNAQVAVIATLVLEQPLISTSLPDLLAQLNGPVERLLVIADDALADGGADQLMEQLRSHPAIGCCRVLLYLPLAIGDSRLEHLWQCAPEGLLSLESGGNGSGLRALIAVLEGEHCLDPRFSTRLRRRHAAVAALPGQCRLHQLSGEEQELIVDLARGHTCGEIARLRQRRCDSVRRALSNLYRRVGVRDQRALVAWGLEQGLLRPSDLLCQLR
jgi:DNA-binding NarL/FixJ family response regulator